jgi:Protein of unknown function (DUF3572)
MPIRSLPGHRTPRAGRQHEQAEELAAAAFGFLAKDTRRLQRFLEVSGLELAILRAASEQPDFLAGVLDHVCGEEELLVAFAAESGIAPSRVLAVRDALNGTWERDTP